MALSVTLTALSSVITLFTIPVILSAAASIVGESVGISLPVGNLIKQNLLLMLLPVLLGIGIHYLWPAAAEKTDKVPRAPAFNKLEASAWPMLSRQKAAKMQVSDACIACGQCVKLCPKGNIRIEDGRAVFGTDCIGCLACLQYCPQEAIHMGGVTVRRERYHNPKVPASELMEKIIHID